jgi:hypothetical protein
MITAASAAAAFNEKLESHLLHHNPKTAQSQI